MQTTAYLPTIRQHGGQFLLVTAVAAAAALGVSFGRWVVPSEGSGPASAPALADVTAPQSAGDTIIERKLAQIDAQEAALTREASATTTTGQSIIEASVVTTREQRIIERKLAQLDAHEVAFTREASAGTSTGQAIIERKLAQLDARGAR